VIVELLVIAIGYFTVLYRHNQRFSDFIDGIWCPLCDDYERRKLELRSQFQCWWYKRKAGRCLKCGYDLIKNESGVCPECGTPIHENRC
jgi:hypothetical protein